MNIETNGNRTAIHPIQGSPDVSQESVQKCINIAIFNAINKQLNCNCFECSIGNNTVSKCISNGSYEASTMLVDAFPSEYETFTGALTDEKGYLLTESLNIKRSDIYCTTLIKCFNIQDTNEQIIQNCLNNYFLKEIELIKPKKLILTHSAFQACLKYQIVPSIGTINYFTKVHTKFYNIEVDMYVIYDFSNLTDQQREAFKQGMKIIL